MISFVSMALTRQTNSCKIYALLVHFKSIPIYDTKKKSLQITKIPEENKASTDGCSSVAPWCYKWIGWDGSLGGVRYRAPYSSKKIFRKNHLHCGLLGKVC